MYTGKRYENIKISSNLVKSHYDMDYAYFRNYVLCKKQHVYGIVYIQKFNTVQVHINNPLFE